jgi:hypothetical protein
MPGRYITPVDVFFCPVTGKRMSSQYPAMNLL